MDEFNAKKFGEVLAFERLLQKTVEKGRAGFEKAFSDEDMEELTNEPRGHAEVIETIAAKYDVTDTVVSKADKTEEKLANMRDLYLADEEDWQDPAELMEWSGFFHGAALVHWRVIEGFAESTGDEELAHLVADSYNFHADMLAQCGDHLKEIAMEKSQE